MDKITIAAVPYVTEEQAQTAFGKVNPYQYGVLPVLVVMENGTGKALRLDLQAEFVEPGGKHVDATPASDVVYTSIRIRSVRGCPAPGRPFRFRGIRRKGPLNTWEIEGRAFAPKMLPAGESAYGFFYFQTEHIAGFEALSHGHQRRGFRERLFLFRSAF